MINKIYFCSFVLAMVFCFGCTKPESDGTALVPEVDFPKISGKPWRFESCADVADYMRKNQESWEREQSRYSSWLRRSWSSLYAPIEPAVSVPASHESVTNLQERDVDEGDKVKVGPHHIFVAQNAGIQVINRKTKELDGVLSTGDLKVSELHSSQGHLIAIGRRSEGNGIVARFYSAKDDELPTFIGEKRFVGDLVGTRLIGSRVFLVLQNRNVNLDAFDESKVFGVSCRDLFGPSLADYDLRVTSVFSLDFTQPDFNPHATAFIGGGDHLYVSQHSLYIVKEGLQWFSWDPREEYRGLRQQTIVTRVGFEPESGRVSTQGVGVIKGRLYSRLAMKEFEETRTLSVVTTEQMDFSRVWLLDLASENGWMKVRSASEEFGRNEEIRSVRFVGPHAYVVTFEKTDPLFVFDLSDPDHVALKSELKIPGFSSYLHDVGSSGLLGVGYEASDESGFSLAQGVQVSLFDISDPVRVSVIKQKAYGARGSYLPVTDDSHAFYYDRSRERAAIPVVIKYGSQWTDGLSAPTSTAEETEFQSGALLLDVRQGLESDVVLSHFDLIPADCRPLQTASRWWRGAYSKSLDIDRVFDLDGSLLTISAFGVRFRDIEDPRKVEKEIVFGRADEFCRTLVGYR